MTTYAIQITEDTLDLIEVLNQGVRPSIEEHPTCFIFDADNSCVNAMSIKIESMYEVPSIVPPILLAVMVKFL